MKDIEKANLKQVMEQKKEELIRLIVDLKEATKPMGLDNSVGRISRMDYINNKSVNEMGLRKAENDLKALDRWLDMYDTDRFGKCSKCGKEINVNRLVLMPASTRCINCAGR